MKFIFTFIAIFFIGIAVYGNILDGDFIWDDESFVVHNEYIRSFKYLSQYFTTNQALAEGGIAQDSYRPFVPMSYALDYKVWGLDPFGYHLTNILLHICNAFIVFLLLRSLFRQYIPVLFGALIFLVHPVQTEVVSWIAGRGNLLFLFFYLLALLAYIRFKESRNRWLYIGSVFLFIMSLLSREMAITLPLILILYAVLFGDNRKAGRIALESLPYFILAGIFVYVRYSIIGSVAQGDWWTGDFFTTFLTMLTGMLYYIKILIWPFGLCADHLTFPIVKTFSDANVIIPLFAISGLFGAAILFLKRRPLIVSFGILWFFITFGPVLNIVPLKILIADRFLYLPMIGYCMVLVSLISLLIRIKKVRLAVFAIIIVFMMGMMHPPPLNDYTKLDAKRRALFVVALIILIICFIPNPISIMP